MSFQYPPAFQLNAFQQAFKKDERSGYWRLFFMQMQEDSLKKDKVAEEAVVEPTTPIVKRAVKSKRRVKVAKSPLPEITLPTFKPVRRDNNADAIEKILSSFWVMSDEVRQWYVDFQPHIVKMAEIRVKIKQRTDAVNDTDYRLRLLLLAA